MSEVVKMSAKRRRELLSLTSTGRAVLADEARVTLPGHLRPVSPTSPTRVSRPPDLGPVPTVAPPMTPWAGVQW